MICNLAAGTEAKIAGTKAVCSIFYKEFITHSTSFVVAKATQLQHLNKKMDDFEVLSLHAQDALLKHRSSSASSVVDEGQASLLAAAVAYN